MPCSNHRFRQSVSHAFLPALLTHLIYITGCDGSVVEHSLAVQEVAGSRQGHMEILFQIGSNYFITTNSLVLGEG